jgi:hypothetical protein
VQVPAVVPAVNNPLELMVDPVHPVPPGRFQVATEVTLAGGPLLKIEVAPN